MQLESCICEFCSQLFLSPTADLVSEHMDILWNLLQFFASMASNHGF